MAGAGVGPATSVYETNVLPTRLPSQMGRTGFEPVASALSRQHSTAELPTQTPPAGVEPALS
jgi:hypothetical protein